MSARNVRDFGARGDGTGDDYVGIKAAVSAAAAAGGGEIYFPTGVYPMGKHDQYAGLFVSRLPPLRFVGDGAGASTIRMLGGAWFGDFNLLRIESDDFELEHLTFDGNRANIPSADEQTHLIQVHDCKRFAARNCELRDAFGDGIKVVGTGGVGGPIVFDLVVERCSFHGNNRSGITCQRAFRDATITGCRFADNRGQDIDFEPTGQTAPGRVIILGNLIDHPGPATAVTLSGVSGTDRTTDVELVDNEINGYVSGIDIRNVLVRGNRIAGPLGKRVLNFGRGIDNLIIDGNLLTTSGVEAAIVVAAGNGRQPVGLSIQNNTIETAGGSGIVLESVKRALVRGNQIFDVGNAGNVGILARATAVDLPLEDVSVRDNQVVSYGTGLLIAGGVNSGGSDISAMGNAFSHRAAGATKKGIVIQTVAPSRLTHLTIGPNHYGTGIATPVSGLTPAGAAEGAQGGSCG